MVYKIAVTGREVKKMRLIDADALKKELRKSQIKSLIEHTENKNIFDIIDEQSTAYDVEKVVAELDNKKYWEYDDEGFSIGMVVSLGNAIMIVRKGGVE